MNVLGDNPAGAEVTMLLDNGADLHSFQPTAEDILKYHRAKEVDDRLMSIKEIITLIDEL